MKISSATYRREGLNNEEKENVAVIVIVIIMTIFWQIPTGNIGHGKKKFKVDPWTKSLNEMAYRFMNISHIFLNLT